jgi:hypothetical protein
MGGVDGTLRPVFQASLRPSDPIPVPGPRSGRSQ